MINIEFKKLKEDVKLPEYATVGSAGFDLIAYDFKRHYWASNENHKNPNRKRGQAVRGEDGQWYIPENHEARVLAGKTPTELVQVTNDIFEYDTVATEVTLNPGDRVLIGCQFAVAIPDGFEMQVRPRSGNALKSGLTVVNSPGTIDSDYRGEIGVILINHSKDAVVIKKGDKVAQGVIKQYFKANFKVVDELSETIRGEGGYGSTDKQITTQNY